MWQIRTRHADSHGEQVLHVRRYGHRIPAIFETEEDARMALAIVNKYEISSAFESAEIEQIRRPAHA